MYSQCVKLLTCIVVIFWPLILIAGDGELHSSNDFIKKWNEYKAKAKYIIEEEYSELLNEIGSENVKIKIKDKMVKLKMDALMKDDEKVKIAAEVAVEKGAEKGALAEQLKLAKLPLERLALRFAREKIQRFSWPAWLMDSNLDEFESWVLAWALIPGANLDMMRDKINGEAVKDGRTLTYETVASGICALNKDISEVDAHSKLLFLDITMPREEPQISQVCSKLCRDETAGKEEQFACKLIYHSHANYQYVGQYKGIEKSEYPVNGVVFYGKISKIKNCPIAETRINIEFSKLDANSDGKPISCTVFNQIVDGSKNPTTNKSKHVPFLIFNATCTYKVTSAEFKNEIRTQLKKDPENSNSNIEIDLYIDTN